MIVKEHPLVVIVTMGHSGSRLLTKLLNDNGVFMGRITCVPGEDSRFDISNNREFEQASLNYFINNNKDDLKTILRIALENYENFNLFGSRFTIQVKERLKNILLKKYVNIKHRSPKTWAIGLKTAISSTMYAEALYDLSDDLGCSEKLYFIHLTRNLSDWLNSGIAKGTKGINRPIYLPYSNNFLNDYNKYLWFDTIARKVEVGDKEFDLVKISQFEMEKFRESLESCLWANANKRALKLRDKTRNYIQIKFEDILINPEDVSVRLSNFFNREIKTNTNSLDKTRVKEYMKEKSFLPMVEQVVNKLGY